MAYYIAYSPEAAHRYPQKVRRRTQNKAAWIAIAMVFAAMLWMRVNGIPDWLIPGDPAVTKEAASLFVEEIQDGEGMNGAVTTFCRTVLDGAGY